MKQLWYILMALLFCSCESFFDKEIDLRLPEPETKVVVDAKIISGDSVRVFTSLSQSLVTRPFLDSTLKVELYEDNILVGALSPDSLEPGFFESNYVAKVNHSYEVRAHHPEFGIARGEDFMKPSASIVNGKAEKIAGRYHVTVEFSDPPTENDYYFFYFNFVNSSVSVNPFFTIYDPTIQVFVTTYNPFDLNDGITANRGYLSDELFNGQSKSINLQLNLTVHPDSNKTLMFNLFRISEDYYQHEKSKAAQNDINEAFGEPVQVYSNINGGVGIVGCASRTTLQLTP